MIRDLTGFMLCRAGRHAWAETMIDRRRRGVEIVTERCLRRGCRGRTERVWVRR